MSLFANLGQTERKTGTLFGSTTAPSGAAPQQTTSGLFGNSTANTGSLFNGAQQQQNAQQNTGGLFSQSQQQQQQQQQPNLTNSIMGGFVRPAPTLNTTQQQQVMHQQQALPKLRQTANDRFASASLSGAREKSIIEQMRTIVGKWDPQSPDCAFQYYFYNAVKPEEAPFYGPAPHEDHKKWEEALANKPGEGSIPILVRGFEEMAARIKYQVLAINSLQHRMHEMNNCLTLIKDEHELKTAPRIIKAKQKHIEHTQRTLALATKVQILRNRGYVMDQAEEDLKKKLLELEKRAFDPINGGRQEEIWARMSSVRERAHVLQKETEKLSNAADGLQNGGSLSEEDQAQLEKILKGYDQQLQHLKKMVDDTKQEYEEWEKEKTLPKPTAGRR
ncbi:Nucleoporin nup57 [Kalmusia sp. IMI 367209]|nr:Nucleoporin nup57 [Kalmusia sp. IMI 367209]